MSQIQGLSELTRALSRFPTRLAAARSRAGRLIGDFARQQAKENAPISPKKKLHSKTLKRRRITARRQFFPGELEKAIRAETLANGDVSVFVTKNSNAWKYARYIHDEKGVRWFKRGAGTVEKGWRADEKFIERAVNDNAERYRRVYEQELQRELNRL